MHLGPQAVALAVLLNKQYGLSYGKIAQLLQGRFGLQVTRGGLTQAVHRAARQAAPSYAALCATVRGSPVVTADETSWRVATDLQWLWAFHRELQHMAERESAYLRSNCSTHLRV